MAAATGRLIRSENVNNALIFCNRKRDVEIFFKSLTKHVVTNAARLHGDMSQPARTETLDKFKRGEARLMVCSDVAARGLDIKGLSHVFNFDVPMHAEDYIHRIGRTGRAGREGHAFTLAAPIDGKYVAAIEKLVGAAIPRIVIEGLEGAALSSGREHRGRGGRHDRGRHQQEKRQRNANEVIDAVVPHPEREIGRHAMLEASVAMPPVAEREPHANRHQRRSGGRNHQDTEQHPPRPQRQDGRVHHNDDGGLPGVAFGDHTPAFLLRRGRTSEAR
ncbi:MAG: C-terminal helicase domain-containing protein [Dongiaceae bacterium]